MTLIPAADAAAVVALLVALPWLTSFSFFWTSMKQLATMDVGSNRSSWDTTSAMVASRSIRSTISVSC